MRPKVSSRFLAVLLASLALRASALGQTSPRIPPEDVASHAFKNGERVQFVGKYMGLVDDRLQLLGMKQSFVLDNPSLKRKLALDYEPSVDNITVEGYLDASKGESDEQVFTVEAIDSAPKDLELYRSRFRALDAEASSGPDHYLRLAEAVHRRLQRSPDAQMTSLAVEIMRRCYEKKAASMRGASLQAKLELLGQLFRRVPLKSLLGEILVELQQEHPDSPEIRKQLFELGYRDLGGKWFSYSEFKRREGFVWDGDHWVKGLDLEHATVAKSLESVNQTNLVLRSRTNRQYRELAKAGEVASGMTREEVLEAVGYPERVRRVRLKDVFVDQWQYTERRVYLFGGKVIIAWEPEVVEESLTELSEAVQRKARGEPDRAPEKDDG